MKTVLGQVIGAWLAFATFALFVRTRTPKDTAITCAYCGAAVPMAVATNGGIGAVNANMRDHIRTCPEHPAHLMHLELALAREQLQAIEGLCSVATHIPTGWGPAEHALRAKLDSISDIAARNT